MSEVTERSFEYLAMLPSWAGEVDAQLCWLGNDSEGRPIMILVHPEYAPRIYDYDKKDFVELKP